MSKKLRDDPWAVKAIQYLVRMDFSTQEVIDEMVEVGIRWGAVKEEKKDGNQRTLHSMFEQNNH